MKNLVKVPDELYKYLYQHTGRKVQIHDDNDSNIFCEALEMNTGLEKIYVLSESSLVNK